MTKLDLIETGETIVKKAIKLGADQSEALIISGNQLSIQIEESSIVKANDLSISGIGLRVLKDKAIGIADSSQITPAILDAMATDAVTLAKASSPNPDNIGFAEKTSSYPIVEGIYNKDLANLGSDKLVDLAIAALNAALEKDEKLNISGRFSLTVTNHAIVNSNGVLADTKGTGINIYLSSKIEKDEDVGVGQEFAVGRKLADIDAEKVGASVADKAFKLLGGKKIDSNDYPFLLDERAVRTTVRAILGQGISAWNITQGTAYFSDMLGEDIAAQKLTVYDNPLQAEGFGARSFDDEGTPCQTLKLVENGTLLTYLSDVYTSNKLDIPNTGSADKQGYGGNPRPALKLIQVDGGDATKEELFAELGTGIYMESPLFYISGTNISQQVDIGYYVEKGEIQYPVKNTMLGTTVYDVLKNIKLIGKDVLVEGGLKSPMILFGPTKFSSGR
ncbi:MAG: TldD/PmbA family protein [Candidatus Heimdallarchaeota archaeon]